MKVSRTPLRRHVRALLGAMLGTIKDYGELVGFLGVGAL